MSFSTNEHFDQEDKQNYLQTFKRYPITFSHGEGAVVWDVEGKSYIDALGGIAVNSVGHNHPELSKAICDQASKLLHVSNFYLSAPQVELSTRLVQLSGLDRVFLTNSGAESVEGAIKIARKYAHSVGRGGTIISFEGSFHGRTMATIATGRLAMQKGFDPIPQGFKQIPFNDIEAARKAIDQDVAAFIIEPIQGEGGINIADKEFLVGLRALCDEHDVSLIFDEIQCGVGRTGKWFAKEHYQIQPDIMTLAKALGGGVPVGAVLSNEKVSSAMEFGDHGTTFGGNPLACRAALTVLQIIDSEGLLNAARMNGDWLQGEIRKWNHPSVKDVRGKGMMIGVEFDFETKELVGKLLERGILANATAGNVLRMVPPLNITRDQLAEVISGIKESVEHIKAHA